MRLVLPIPVARALRKLGSDIQGARRRRRIGMALIAERAGISRTTLGKIERGEDGVSMGNYACVLFSLGMIDRLTDLMDITHDRLALAIEEDYLPKRIRTKKRD